MADLHIPLDSQRLLIEIARQTLEYIVRGWSCDRAGIDDPYLEIHVARGRKRAAFLPQVATGQG